MTFSYICVTITAKKEAVVTKTGLVLEGGGVRGIYTAGVLDVFMERGLTFDALVGVSAGAIHGCSYLSNQHGRSIRYYEKYCGDPRFMSFQSFLKTGDVVGVDFCYHELPDVLDPYDYEAFLKNETPFYAVCSNVETGEAEYPQLTDMRAQIDLLRASASLPYFSRIVEFGGKKYLDGGCTDSIPVDAARRLGCARNVVVLTREESYRKSAEKRLLTALVYRKYPAFAAALRRRHEMYNAQVARVRELERAGEIFVIRPASALGVGRMEKDTAKVRAAYETGRADATAKLEALDKWLKGE